MDITALVEALRPGAAVALDSNAVFGKQLLSLADVVNQHNVAHPAARIGLMIPLVVHAEHLAQEVRRFGLSFDLKLPLEALRSKGFEDPASPHRLVAFEQKDADEYAQWLGTTFPRREDWNRAKRAQCAKMLGVQAPPSSGPCSATSDWLIAAQVRARGWILITQDRGVEFQAVDRKTTARQLQEAIVKLGAK